jgi:hypothetical protein
VSADVYVTPPLRLDVPFLHVIATARGCLILATPIELADDDLLRVGFTEEGRIVGVWVQEGASA